MSDANDDPANDVCGDEACGLRRWRHAGGSKGHAFVEPTTQPVSDEKIFSLAEAQAIHDGARLAAPQTAPSGDEAKVREIAERWKSMFPAERATAIKCIVSEAYAAGKADGAREERETCVAIAQEAQRLQAIRRHKSKLAVRAIGDLRDAIARRGSEP